MESHEAAQDFDNCLSRCSPFCQLSDHILQHLDKVTSRVSCRKKERLFIEGQEPRGIFILCTGKAKLFTCSTSGKVIITRCAEAGDVLGLNAVVSNRRYGVTAEMMINGQVNFIARCFLMQLMKEYDELAFVVAEQLSRSYFPVHDALRSLGLTSHPVERLAKLLLSWTDSGTEDVETSSKAFKLPLTHQEIAERIGSTRETVSKLFAELRTKRLLESNGAALAITNRLQMEKIVQF
jgi:CRP/FNR family transcriptional regulator, cyclic AMP receptor protein